MKNFTIFLKLFFTGAILAFIMSTLTHCPEPSPTEPIIEPAVETAPMKQYSETVIIAFQSGDKQKVVDLMYDEYKEIYGKQLENATSKSMADFASALENRKIIKANELYAEYELTINGMAFTIAYSNDGNGNWKLERL